MQRNQIMKAQPLINTQPIVSDEIRKTTCYMCACRCGINVHLKDGEIRRNSLSSPVAIKAKH
jgi:anaerobic selenocysteine-containing dehydrogenase